MPLSTVNATQGAGEFEIGRFLNPRKMRTRQVPTNLFLLGDTFSAAFPLQRVRTLQAAFAVAPIDSGENAYDARETKSLPATLCTRKRIKYPQNREYPRFDVSGYTVPQAGAHLFVVELIFRENKLSGERLGFPDSRRPQGLHTRGRHSAITESTASLGRSQDYLSRSVEKLVRLLISMLHMVAQTHPQTQL